VAPVVTVTAPAPTTATPASGGARLAFLGFLAATLAVHGVVAWLSPLQGDDWRQLLWSPGDGGWLAGHAQLADACGYLIARSTVVHAIASPIAGVVMILGVFTLGARRLPDPGRWRDVLGVALVSSMIWIALPRAGVMWFHRPYVAAQMFGAALVVWFVAAYRCRWRLGGRAGGAAMFAIGLVAGTTTRQLVVMAVVGVAIATGRTPRAARRGWMLPGLVGLVLGAAASVVHAPWAEVGRVLGRFEPTLVALGPLMRAGGQLIALIALLVLATLVRASRRAPTAPQVPDAAAPDDAWRADAPDAGEALGWFGAWLGLGVAALLGPRSTEATQLPAAIALCAGALPWLSWLARLRIVRRALVALVVGVHLVAWAVALATYAAFATELTDRMAAIAATPADGVAIVRPYSQIVPTYWWFGEDWSEAGLREALARERWGLAGIELAPGFRQLERGADLALVLEVEGVSGDQLQAARPPRRWARELAPARRQFAALIDRLRAITGRQVRARLRVTDVELAGRAPRPILAAWADGAAVVAPEVARSAPDATSQTTVTVAPSLGATFGEAWAVGPDGARPVRCTTGRCVVQLLRAERTVIVLCNAERCLAADAWVPHF
jgi:hypothetical protein